MTPQIFRDRRHAGSELATLLTAYARRSDVTVLALPRGGVPVGFEVARALQAPLDVFLVRKLGVPGHEEYAMGAIASGGVRVLNRHVVQVLGIDADAIEAVARNEERELARRELEYRGDRPPPAIAGRAVILVDDGLATGATMTAAIQALRSQRPARIVVAVPTAAPDSCAEIQAIADDIICATKPKGFRAVSQSYEDFGQTGDEEVRQLLERSQAELRAAAKARELRSSAA